MVGTPDQGGIEIVAEDPTSDDARSCLAWYFDELDHRFDGGFDVDASLDPDAAAFSPPSGQFLIARLGGEPVGCAAIKFEEGAGAMIKRMWVSGKVRGMGLGRRLLADLERRASERGMTLVRLETNQALTEAMSLYRSAGYEEVEPFNCEPYAHHWFEKRI